MRALAATPSVADRVHTRAIELRAPGAGYLMYLDGCGLL